MSRSVRTLSQLKIAEKFNSGDLTTISEGSPRTLSGWLQKILGRQGSGECKKRWASRKQLLSFFLLDSKVRILLFLLGIRRREKELIVLPKGMKDKLADKFPDYDLEEVETGFDLGTLLSDPKLVLVVTGCQGFPDAAKIKEYRPGVPVILATDGIPIRLGYAENPSSGELHIVREEMPEYAAKITKMEDDPDKGTARLVEAMQKTLSAVVAEKAA